MWPGGDFEFTHQLELLFPYLLHSVYFSQLCICLPQTKHINTTPASSRDNTSNLSLSYMIPFSSMRRVSHFIFISFRVNMITKIEVTVFCLPRQVDTVRPRHGESCRIPVPHHFFLSLKSLTYNTIGEDTDVFFSLYDMREGKQIR